MTNNVLWDDAQDEELRRLLSRGMSARQAGAELGRSKSSIISRCHRKNIPLNANPPFKEPKVSKRPLRKPRLKLVKTSNKSTPTQIPGTFLRPAKTRWSPDEPRPSLGTPHRLDQLPFNGCKYPVHRGADGEWLLCSEPRQRGPYCLEHYAQCHEPRKRRA